MKNSNNIDSSMTTNVVVNKNWTFNDFSRWSMSRLFNVVY
jgi:putative flippase GtrA